jgi:hypothetical protein
MEGTGSVIKYPTWKVRGNPTPNDRLMICDKCREAHWYVHGWPTIVYCHQTANNAHHGRMREGTEKEYTEAKAALKTII